jgi:predicted Zn finger-like uncharacterized protein
VPSCATCGHETVRTRRNSFQKLYTLAIFKCPKCDDRFYLRRKFLGIFGRYVQCPKCGTMNLSKFKNIDRIDRVNKNPFRLALSIVGAPLYHCTFCRLQFWDWRSRDPEAEKERAARR